MVTNLDRADCAGSAIVHFRCMTGTDCDDVLPDLLCDLMHWSDREDINFQRALDLARAHYQTECDEESDEENLENCKPTVRSKNVAKRMSIAETAIYANLSALAELLAEAAKFSTEAADASKCGEQNQAIGTALPLDDLISQSKALYDAAIALHRHSSRG